MAYVNVPNDLSKIKTKLAFGLTKRQLICFGVGGLVGVPLYLITRKSIGNTAALFLMLVIMLPAFLLAMYERDGLPLEKVLRNVVRAAFLRPSSRPYQTENIYAPFVGKEESFAKIQTHEPQSKQKPKRDQRRQRSQPEQRRQPEPAPRKKQKRRKKYKHEAKHLKR